MCRLLLDHGSDIQNRNSGGGTALHTFTNPSVWQVLRRSEPDVNLATRDEFDRTILHYLVWSSQTTPASLQPYCEDRHRPEFSSSIGVRDNCGRTPIHLAAQRGNASLTAYLLSLTPGPSPPLLRDKAGRTPLHHATQSRRAPETIAALTAAVVGTQALLYAQIRDHAGRTALHEAAALRNAKAVVALLALEGTSGNKAADAIRNPDYAGVTPSELLRAWQADNVVGEESALPEEVEQMLADATLSISEGASTRRGEPGQVWLKNPSLGVKRGQIRFFRGLKYCYLLTWSIRLLLGSILLAILSFIWIVLLDQ